MAHDEATPDFAAEGREGLEEKMLVIALSEGPALQVALNQIVEQACLATGAAGAAIALQIGDEMIYRATSGGNTPAMGSRLNTTEGLTGACVRSREIQCCRDLLTDPQAAADISKQTGVRSAVVYPVMQGNVLIGILEIFSPRSAAFGDRDLQTLKVLSERIAKNYLAREKSLVSGFAVVPSEKPKRPLELVRNKSPQGGETGFSRLKKPFDWFTALSGATIVCVAVMMGTVFGIRAGWMKVGSAARGRAQKQVSSGIAPLSSSSSLTSPPSSLPSSMPGSASGSQPESFGGGMPDTNSAKGTPRTGPLVPAKEKTDLGMSKSSTNDPSIPAGGLLVSENGHVIFRMAPTSIQTGTNHEVSANSPDTPRVSSDSTSSILLRRVEPKYPEQALAQRVQGPVSLHVRIAKDGTVETIKVLNGDPVLTDAAIAAVRRWRFKPRLVEEKPVEMETEITLNFKLPQS